MSGGRQEWKKNDVWNESESEKCSRVCQRNPSQMVATLKIKCKNKRATRHKLTIKNVSENGQQKIMNVSKNLKKKRSKKSKKSEINKG